MTTSSVIATIRYGVTRSTSSVRFLALTGVAGPILFWTVVVVVGFLTPGYDHGSSFISTLGAVGAPYAAVQRVNFVVLGAAIGAFALGLHRWFDDGWKPSIGTVLLGLFGLGVVGAGLFSSHPAAPESTTNELHNTVTGLALLTGMLAISLTSHRLDADDRWPRHRLATAGIVSSVLLTAALFGSSIDTAWVGLGQRLFVGTLTLWIVVIATRLYRLAGDATTRSR